MSLEIFYAGLFGVFATLCGCLAAYCLSFSRDKRLRNEELKVIYAALKTELLIILKGLTNTETHLPRFGSMNVFTTKGGGTYAPAELSIALENISSDLERIEDITKEVHAFDVAVASAGEPNLVFVNDSLKEERAELIANVKQSVPKLVKLLESYI